MPSMRSAGAAPVLSVLLLLGGCAFGYSDISGGDGDQGPGPGTGGGGDNNGGNGGNNGGNDDDGDECAEDVELAIEVVANPPDMLVVMDRSSSIGQVVELGSLVRRWDVVRDALDSVLAVYQTRANFGLMLVPPPGQYFCDAGVIDVAPSVQGASQLTATLDATEPGGASPTAPSLANARAYYAGAPVNPHGRYVILVSDGQPSCGIEAANETRKAIEDLHADGIDTFVLGYAQDGLVPVLDGFAAAGGTLGHYPAYTSDTLVAALESISTSVTTVSCEYQLSDGPSAAESLTVTRGGALVPYSPDHTDGWDFDPTTATLTFHGPACDALRDPSVGTVRASFCQIVE